VNCRNWKKIGNPSGCQVSTRERACNQMGFSTLKATRIASCKREPQY